MTERKHHGRIVRQELRVNATPEAVYQAFADPEGIARWFVDRAEGEAEAGKMMIWHFDAMDMHLPVPIAEVVPGERFVVAGEIPGRLPFVQDVVFTAEGGETVIRLANSGFREGAEWEDEYEGVDSGWQLALAMLKHQLENYPGVDRIHVLTTRPAALDYSTLLPLFVTAGGLASWLAEDAEIPGGELRAGSGFRLTLAGGGELNGQVLARSRREVLLSWPEEDAVLGLRSFSLGGSNRAVGLDYSSWSRSAPSESEVRSRLEAALDRLLPRIPVPTD